MRWAPVFLLLLLLPRGAAQQGPRSADKRCLSVEVSKGDIGEGKLSYCDDGVGQEIYLSGEIDIRDSDKSDSNAADLVALKKILHEFRKREKGVFRVVTNNAGGGETEWHQRLMMAVEDACILDCTIITEVRGRCESACNQLHFTCVRNARTIVHKGAANCEHATTDEDSPQCNHRDPFNPKERDLCGVEVAVNEYKSRCGDLTKGRGLNIDEQRKKQIFEFIDRLAKNGVFDTTKLTCTPLTWAASESTVACGEL
ncbi:MAG TPA: hypothetical protein VJV05_10015 [Pyrinomonadaceae bacterium]|nr:hypothetical protein [Pyrinomonadaceae bacterium]